MCGHEQAKKRNCVGTLGGGKGKKGGYIVGDMRQTGGIQLRLSHYRVNSDLASLGSFCDDVTKRYLGTRCIRGTPSGCEHPQ